MRCNREPPLAAPAQQIHVLERKGNFVSRTIILSVLLATILFGVAGSSAAAQGIVWENLTIEQALAKAKKNDTMVLIDVYSDHCHQCHDMDDQFWNTPLGAELGEGLVCLRVASDKPESSAIRQRYPILGLPLAMFIGPDGNEFGRLVGYRDHDAFVQESKTLKNWIEQAPSLEAKVEQFPESAQFALELMEYYLYQKRDSEAETLLRKIMKIDDLSPRPMIAPRALSITAKYYDYFKHNKMRSQGIWKSQVVKYAHTGMATSGITATFDYAHQTGHIYEWIDWMCEILKEINYPPRVCYTIAMRAYRSGLKHECLALAGQKAVEGGVGPDNMAEIAASLKP
jgi:thioredoxin-related protein